MRRRLAFAATVALAGLLAVSCGSASLAPVAAPVRPTLAGLMAIGVNAQFYGPLPQTQLQHLVTDRIALTRSPITNVEQARAILAASAGLVRVMLVVETWDDALVAAIAAAPDVLAQTAAIELGNELDASLTAQQFGSFVARSATTLLTAGFTGDIISGGIGNVEPDTLRWMAGADMSAWPVKVIVGIHVYRRNATSETVQGYTSRGAEAAAVRGAVDARRVAVTEFGYKHDVGMDEQAIQQAVKHDIAEWYNLGAAYAVVYQLFDDPRPGQGHFGIWDAAERDRLVVEALR